MRVWISLAARPIGRPLAVMTDDPSRNLARRLHFDIGPDVGMFKLKGRQKFGRKVEGQRSVGRNGNTAGVARLDACRVRD